MNALKLMGSMQVNILEYLGWSKPNIAGWKMGAPDGVDVFPIKHGDIPASYVSLPEGRTNPTNPSTHTQTLYNLEGLIVTIYNPY